MVRRSAHGSHNGVPWRSHEVSRIEALSDAVFAFAVTLLVVALEVPETFADLLEKMRGLPAFAISFTLLFQVWYTQNTFFRRFGLQDTVTVTLNGVLLFLVLFYMYPLKFLAGLLTSVFMGHGGMAHLHSGEVVPMLANRADGVTMMYIYNLGFGGVFLVFLIMFWHVWRHRADLELSEIELFDLKSSIERNGIMVGIAVLSSAVLVLTQNGGIAGLVYLLIMFAQTAHGFWKGRQRRKRFGMPETVAV